MTNTYNPPVTIQVYLGSGKPGATLRENIKKRIRKGESLSEVVVALLKKADPGLFKGVDDDRK